MRICSVERRRIIEAAQIYSLGEGLSPQGFTDRIIRHPEVTLRTMREGVRPISRKAIANLIAGKDVKEPTLDAVKRYIVAEKRLPRHLFDVDESLVQAARAEMVARKAHHYPHPFFELFRGKFVIHSRRRYAIWFEIDYDREFRVLLMRGKVSMGSVRDGNRQDFYISGYAFPTSEYICIYANDYESKEGYIININIYDFDNRHYGVFRKNVLTMNQGNNPSRVFLPLRIEEFVDKIVPSRIVEKPKIDIPILNRHGNRFFDQDFTFSSQSDYADMFWIGGEKYSEIKLNLVKSSLNYIGD